MTNPLPVSRPRRGYGAATMMLLLLLAFVPRAAFGQDDPFGGGTPAGNAGEKKARKNPTDDRIDLVVSLAPKQARRGEVVTLTITGTPRSGYHTYPLTERSAGQDVGFLAKLKYGPARGLRPLWPVRETDPVLVKEGDDFYLEHRGEFRWTQDVLVLADAPVGPLVLPFSVKLQVCDDRTCVWGEHAFRPELRVTDAPAVALTAELRKRLEAPEPPIKVVGGEGEQQSPAPEDKKPEAAAVPAAGGTSPEGPAAPRPSLDTGLVAFLLQGVFWGAVSLVTPCVFPMIPITVSFFLKHSEREHHRPVAMALVYCLTIIAVLTVAAVTLLSFFRWLSVNPVMNFGLGALFIFFALSLFGMYEIQLPSGLARYTSVREGRGGMVGTVFMALTFTIISFACVAPFLGGFGGTAAGSHLTWTHRVLGGLAFSVTFASPFFLLALFPTLLRGLPKSGSWLNSVKVVMGFLELAAALKFFRAGELVLRPTPQFFTYDLVLGMYVALSLLCGLYLLNLFHLPHDTPAEHLGVPRLLFSFLFISLALYLTPGLFKYGSQGESQRPSGQVFAWLDSFLLPDPHTGGDTVAATGQAGGPAAGEAKALAWVGDLRRGIGDAIRQGRLVFLDFTGITCTNCNLNERDVFTRPEVRDLLEKYELVKLYTDRVPNWLYPPAERAALGDGVERQRADAEANLKFQRDQFDTEQLPLYVIVNPLPDGRFKEVARYAEGKINDLAAFTQFLRQPLLARVRNTGVQARAN